MSGPIMIPLRAHMLPWRVGDTMTLPGFTAGGVTRGTDHHVRVASIDHATLTITTTCDPLKWPGAPRYFWKRYFRKGTRKVKRLSRRVHRARRKAERALALTCVATGGAHTPAPTRAVCEACGISKLRVVRGGGQL